MRIYNVCISCVHIMTHLSIYVNTSICTIQSIYHVCIPCVCTIKSIYHVYKSPRYSLLGALVALRVFLFVRFIFQSHLLGSP